MGWSCCTRRDLPSACHAPALSVSRPEVEKDWRDQADGLRQRLTRDDVPRASYEDDRDAGHAYDRLNL